MQNWSEFGYELLKDAILIGGVGVLITILLERYKNKLSLIKEINRARVDKISECWEEHSELEYQLYEVHSELKKIEGDNISNELRTKCDNLIIQREIVKKTQAKHKFWLPKVVTDKSKEYLSKFDEYKIALCNGEKKKCEDLKRDIDKNALTVDELLGMLLKGIKR